MRIGRSQTLFLAAVLLVAGVCLGQFQRGADFWPRTRSGGRHVQIEGGAVVDEDTVRTARETLLHSAFDTPSWTNTPGFDFDDFTFVRVIFQSDGDPGSRGGFGRRLGWWVDYPDADLNFSYRLQQQTSIRTDPDARVLKLTDPALNGYPLIYIEHAGFMRLNEDEERALRNYLSSGGVLFVNDFWSTREWDGFAAAIGHVLPDRTWTELTTDHPLFQCVFNLKGPMHRLRVPTMQFWNEGFDANDPGSEPHRVYRGEGSDEMHVRAMMDDRGRIMILAIHNSDVSDGWEREGQDNRYFNLYSERVAYPLGINIIAYLMTH